MATRIAAQRIQREFKELGRDEGQGTQYWIEVDEADILNIKGYINGPLDTPYEGGQFLFDMKVPETYPFQPPKVSF